MTALLLPLPFLLFFLTWLQLSNSQQQRQPQPQQPQQQQEYFPPIQPHTPCRNELNEAQKCSPEYKNIAFNTEFAVTSTCGYPAAVEYCVQSGSIGLPRACDICDARSPSKAHHARYLTDLTTFEEDTWWQSESMYEGVTAVNLTLKFKKAFDIIHITMKFHSARPDSLAIYKKTSTKDDQEWTPFQYFSQSCFDMYGVHESDSVPPGRQESKALCKSEYTEHTPLTGGSVVFSTLEGRPTARHNYENSNELNEWVSASEIMISLDRLNTFGDDVFGDEKVLKSYFYAISDITIGGTCKCNGHARECRESRGERGEGQLVCMCEHNTAGVDCEICRPGYNDLPWGRATSTNAHECKACDCHGFSSRCYFNRTLYEETGSGGHCIECERNRAGPHCETCRENYYEHSSGSGYCIECNCDPTGSRSLQCNSEGVCTCLPGVTGSKCNQCLPDHYQFTADSGCRDCECVLAGSAGNSKACDSVSGKCACKENVEGDHCEFCKLNYFNLEEGNQFGCTPCFCYGHSSVCKSSTFYSEALEMATFESGISGWTAQSGSTPVPLHFNPFTQNLEVLAPSSDPVYFLAPDRFRHDQRGAYNQHLNFSLRIGELGARPGPEDIILEGNGLTISRPIFAEGQPLPSTSDHVYSVRLHEHPDFGWNLPRGRLTAREFMTILENLTAIKIKGTYSPRGRGFLDNVTLKTARVGASRTTAPWMEDCTCPEQYVGAFCESCKPGYTRDPPNGGKFARCVKCNCHGHGVISTSADTNYTNCDPSSGRCICQEASHTAGDNCEKCAKGWFGNARRGAVDDCKKCPCPNGGACIQLQNNNTVCLECPVGYAGPLCEVCGDGYYGDPSKNISCAPCDCKGNIDPNAVGNCHRITGECQKCIYNTVGAQCQDCLPGYYGEALAIPHSNCQPCDCNVIGSRGNTSNLLCTQTTGQCDCKDNVDGRQCDVCKEGYFDIQSGQGCKDCGCDPIGSESSSCHPSSGQCQCRVGVVGLTCKQCAPNTYGFSEEGCKPCDCDYVGSLGLQCDSNGQCPCRDNVEGRRCDRCKENKHSRELGCVDCPVCYNLVSDAVNSHRSKLAEMEKLLEDIRNAPTVVSDREFEMKLQTVQNRVNKLWSDARSATGADDRSFIEKVGELRDKLRALEVLDGEIRSTIDQCSIHSSSSERNLTIVQSTIDSALEALKQAQRFLDTEGKDSLAKAEAKAKEYGEQSSVLSELAREARLLADKHWEAADSIERLGIEALNTSSVAVELAGGSLAGQAEAKEEARLLLRSIQQLEDELKSTQSKATESLQKAREAYNDALSLYKDANTLSLPSIDLQAIKEQALKAKADAVQLQESVLNLVKGRELLLKEAEEEYEETRGRLAEAVKHQQIAEDLMGDLDKAKAEAEEARVQSEETFRQAQEIFDTLLDFNRNVEESKEKAAAAGAKIPAIRTLIAEAERETMENQRDLVMAQRLASEALANAEEAKQVAELASNNSNSIKVDTTSTKSIAADLRDSTNRVAGLVAEVSNRLSAEESKISEEDAKVKAALDKASEAQSTARSTYDKVQSALSTVRDIQLALDNLPEINEAGLDDLNKKITAVEVEFNEAKLDEKLAELRSARNQQAIWLKKYEEELAALRKEAENVHEIRNSLPPDTKCWKKLRLEP